MFSPQGNLALMFLKAYTSLSDRNFYEQINRILQYQKFCEIFLGPEKLADFKVIRRIRTEMAKRLDIR
jgi:transposase